MNSTDSDSPKAFSFGKRLFQFFSGFGLATVLLLLMGLLTWFATLEQIDNGLYATLNKYFHWKSLVLLPEIKGKLVPLPLPGGYWVGALLLLNLILGGVIRARKGWKHIGNLIAHSGIILMLVAGGVAHHFSERGNMAVSEKGSSNTAEDYFEYVVELVEVDSAGKPGMIHVIRGNHLTDLRDGRSRVFRFPDLPFAVEIAGHLENAVPVNIHERAPQQGEKEVDGYYLLARKGEVEAERNAAGCYARLVHADGSKSAPFILSGAAFHPHSFKDGGRVFVLNMRKRLWPMPFTLHLDEFTAEFHPGTMRPAKFVSKVTRVEGGSEAKVTIQMNEPMRYEGLTFYQASYGPPGAKPGEPMYSVFEVVRNPADKWPEYSLYIVAFGMLVAFLIKLVLFLIGQSRKRS